MILNDDEREWIDKYGFTVSTNSWDEYVLIDPQLPKGQNQFKGKDLSELMLEAIKHRRKDGNGEQQQPPRKMMTPKAVVITTEKVKQLKQLKHGKMFHMKRMIIENETITVDQVLNGLKELGMPSTSTVVTTVRSDMLDSLRLLRELNALNC